jgi:hypothetical protein
MWCLTKAMENPLPYVLEYVSRGGSTFEKAWLSLVKREANNFVDRIN